MGPRAARPPACAAQHTAPGWHAACNRRSPRSAVIPTQRRQMSPPLQTQKCSHSLQHLPMHRLMHAPGTIAHASPGGTRPAAMRVWQVRGRRTWGLISAAVLSAATDSRRSTERATRCVPPRTCHSPDTIAQATLETPRGRRSCAWTRTRRSRGTMTWRSAYVIFAKLHSTVLSSQAVKSCSGAAGWRGPGSACQANGGTR